MKILIIMAGFFPGRKYGGPPVSVDNFCSLLKESAECFIVTHNHDLGDYLPYEGISSSWNIRNNAKVLYLSDEEFGYNAFDKIIREIHPDLLYLQGLFQECVFPCLRLAKKRGVRVLLAPRGELCAGAFKKKYKKIPYILGLRLMGLLGGNIDYQSTSLEETEAIKHYLGVSRSKIHFLTNVPSIPNKVSQHEIKIKGIGHFVFISRIVRKKNLLSAINYLFDIKGTVYFDIYGPVEDANYWKECEGIINKLPSNVIVQYKGILNHSDINKTFSQYDSLLFPTYSENYGHVIAEALNSGCVSIISDQTPWTDMNESEVGYALPLENSDLFVQAIQKVVDMDDDEMRLKRNKIEIYINEKQNAEEIRRQYLQVIKNI